MSWPNDGGNTIAEMARCRETNPIRRGPSTFQPLPDDVCMDCLGRRDQHDHNGFRIFTKDEPMTWAQRERTVTRIVCQFRYLSRAVVCTVCGGTIRAGEDDRECQNCGEHYHFGVCSHECGTCSSCGRERLLLNGRCQLCRRENR